MGAPSDNDYGSQSGAAYVFERTGTNWIKKAKLAASDASEGQYFGCSVSISGETILIGCRGNSDLGKRAGAAYVYRWSGTQWLEQAKLTAPDAAAYDEFGSAVSVQNTVIFVGAPFDDDIDTDTGSVHVFWWNGNRWTWTEKLTASDPLDDDFFGSSISISLSVAGDRAVIGASSQYNSEGSAYLFTWNGLNWNEQMQLEVPSETATRGFGKSVSISGDFAAVGAWQEDGVDQLTGAAHAFFLAAGMDCDANGVLDECDITAGNAQDCNGNFLPDVCEPQDDCNANGTQDICDLATETSPDCNLNGVPDECDVASGISPDCNGNGVPDSCDVLFAASPDCNSNSIPDECDVASGTADDCNLNGIPDACDVTSGDSPDCNDNTIPDECDVGRETSHDCNRNIVPDECEPDEDCNGNGISDICDLGSGLDADCNGNEILDGCDIASGTSQDCNGNGVPDECETLPMQIAELSVSEPATEDDFGRTVSISGDRALISRSVAAHVFRWTGLDWIEESKLIPENVVPGEYSGLAAAIDNGIAVVAAEGSGFAYAFRWNGSTWTQEATLTPSVAPFDSQVAISEEVILLGSADWGNETGAVSVFRWNGSFWMEEATLTGSGSQSHDRFGGSVSISGDVAVVGAWGNDDQGEDSGTVYVFRWDGIQWLEESRPYPSEP